MAKRFLELTPEELARVQKRKRQDEATKVSPEELFIAEFGYYYGWEAVRAIMNNEITITDAQILLSGARKVWNAKIVDLASAMFTATASAQSGKKAKQNMKKGLSEFIKQSRADT